MVAGQQDRGALTRRLVQSPRGLRRSTVTKDCILVQIHQIADRWHSIHRCWHIAVIRPTNS